MRDFLIVSYYKDILEYQQVAPLDNHERRGGSKANFIEIRL
jgi:hypothetical protein